MSSENDDNGRPYQSLLLMFTNLMYLVPALVVAIKAKKEKGTALMEEGVILIVFFLITFFCSWSYHQCRGDKLREYEMDLTEQYASHNIPACSKCDKTTLNWLEKLPFSRQKLRFVMLKFIDYFMATFSLIVSLLYILPLRECIKRLILVVTIVWMILFLSVDNDTLTLLPLLFLMTTLLLFWYYSRNACSDKKRNVVWGLGVITFFVAITFYEFDKEPYWIKHSLWHIFGAISISLFLSKTAVRYENIDIDKFYSNLPKDLKPIFKTVPNVCSW